MNQLDVTTALIGLLKKLYLPDSNTKHFYYPESKRWSYHLLSLVGWRHPQKLTLASSKQGKSTSNLIFLDNNVIKYDSNISYCVPKKKDEFLKPSLFVVNLEGNHISLDNHHKSQNKIFLYFQDH